MIMKVSSLLVMLVILMGSVLGVSSPAQHVGCIYGQWQYSRPLLIRTALYQ